MATTEKLDAARFLNERVGKIPASGIRRFFDMISGMEGVISLGVGEPDFTTPEPLREAAVASIRAGRTSYTSNYGTPELRDALAEHLQRLYSVEYDPRTEMLITVGVSEALDITCRAVLAPGDEMIVPDPSYVAYAPAVVLTGAVPVFVPTSVETQFAPTAEEIERHVTPATKAILLGYPNNPTGAVLPREELVKIAQLAERHDLLVVADEIYDRLVYGVEHTCFASLPGMRERTVLLGGFSKDYAMTGWRVGYACAPAPLLEAMMKIHQYVIMCAPTAAQAAALEALRSGEPYVLEMLAEYDRRRRTIVDGLNQIGLPTYEPHGAFYAFPDVRPTGLTSEQFVEDLLREEKVVTVPGGVFGASGDGYARLCYANSTENIEEALERIHRFVRARTG